jgi:signal transduction histidine kinase
MREGSGEGDERRRMPTILGMPLESPAKLDLLALFELPLADAHGGLEDALARTVELCAAWFQASGATLFLRKEETDDFELAAWAGKDARVPLGATIRQGQGIAGTAIAKDEPMLLSDPYEHVLLEGKLLRTQSEIGSSLVVPLHTRHLGALGVLCLSRHRGEPEFSKADLKIARTVAGQIALAVANARLFVQAAAAAETRRLAEIGQMTAAIAHEIRNPLAGMRAAAQVLKSLEGEAAELGGIVVEEVDKLDRLCTEFLDFARPLEIRPEPAALGLLVRRVAEMHHPEFQEKGVRLDWESSDEEPKMNLDRLRIEQVCRNLLRNALQACAPGGAVLVKAVGGVIEVRDDGTGMDEEQLARLFVPFFTTKPQGTGLGMSVVKKIVEAHGGHIEVESGPGQGSCIRIRLK